MNEDRYLIQTLSEDLLLFAIFDGHGGATAVDFVKDNLESHLKFWLNKTDDLYSVLQHSFIDINNVLTRNLSYYNLGEETTVF